MSKRRLDINKGKGEEIVEDTPDSVLADSLGYARIPREFHKKEISFATYWKHAKDNKRWSDELRRFSLGGRVDIVIGEKAASPSLEATYVLARALVLNRVSVKCYSLPTLIRMAESREEEDKEELTDTDCLVLLGFFDPYYKENPLPKEVAHRAEWMLESFLSRGQSLVLHCAGGTSNGSSRLPMEADTWWPRRLLARLERNVVNKYLIP